MPELSTDRLMLAYGQDVVVPELSLRIPTGRVTALVGANGSGKSTILRALARLLRPRAGAALLDGRAIHTQSTRQIARQLAILPQTAEAPGGLTVRELVAHGRFPHQRGFGRLGAADHQRIDWAIHTTHLADLADRPLETLSGGQRQRAWIAMALAQDTPILLLDEPTTYLDMSHQLEVLELLARLNRDEGRTIVMVLHDLNQASRYAHHLVAIRDGRVLVEGPPADVVSPEVLRAVFGIEAHVVPCPRYGVPLCIPYAADGSAQPCAGHDASQACAACDRAGAAGDAGDHLR